MEKVFMNIDTTEVNEGKKEIEVIFINGNRVEIEKGKDVEVSPIIRDVYNEAKKNFREGNLQKKPLILEG